jgi:hypothetical protein
MEKRFAFLKLIFMQEDKAECLTTERSTEGEVPCLLKPLFLENLLVRLMHVVCSGTLYSLNLL